MREKQIRELLHHANDRQTEKIAAYPATEKRTKDRIYQQIRRRKSSVSGTEDAEMETYTVQEVRHAGWSHYVGAAAAILLVVGSAACGVYLMKHAPRNQMQPETTINASQESVPAEAPTVLETTIPPTTESEKPTKELIYYRCTTSIQYLTQLSGNIKIWDTNFDFVLDGNILFDYEKSRFYGTVRQLELDTGRVVYSDERFVSDGRSVRFADCEDWDFIYADGTAGHSDKVSFSTYEGQAEVDRNNFLCEPTGFHELAGCFQPYDMTDGYLSDMKAWEITGTVTYQGRECAVIEGTTDDYGRRWNVTHFKIVADIETGVWLFYEGCGADGNVNSYLYTSDMVFGDTAIEVPGITEEEVDERIAARYVMDDQSIEWRKQIQSELADIAAATESIEAVSQPTVPYCESETMPEPFADGTVPDEYCHPCETRFEDIPSELTSLVSEEAYAEWLASWTPLAENAVTSVTEYPNKYTFIRDFGLTDEQVRDALKEYIRAWDPEISLRDDELSAITSGNEIAMLQNFADKSFIVVRDRVYTPKWMYEHSIQDYVNAGITPQQVRLHMNDYAGFGFTPEAKSAFLDKMQYYAQ